MSLGTLNAALVTLRVMSFLRKQVPALDAVSTDFSGEQADFDQQIIARVITVPAVADYSAVDGYVAGDPAAVDVPVTINKHRHVTLEFNVTDLSSTKRNLIDEQAKVAAYALGKDLVDAVLALGTVANFGTEVVETVANTQRSTLGKIRKQLNAQGATPMGRFGILASDPFENLTDDERIVSSLFNPGSQQDNRPSGLLTGIKGFEQIIEYVDLPAAGNMTGFFGTKDALVVATRIPKDPALLFPELAGGGSIEIVKDPDTGMSMLVRQWYDWQAGKVYFSLVWMYGAAKGVTGQATRLVSAANV
jgi:hypothetical protein